MLGRLVDIDAAVLDAARRFFPRTAAGLDDPRTTVVVGDGAAYAAAAAARGERYDLVVGGGDGGCAREALRWPNVTVTLVAASCGGDEFREISTGETKRNRYRHAW